MADRAGMFPLRAAVAVWRFLSGYPMDRVEMAMDRNGRWLWVFRDRHGKCWLANGPMVAAAQACGI